MRLQKFIVSDYDLTQLVHSEAALNELKQGLMQGIAYKIPHSLDVKKMLEIRDELDKTFDLYDDSYTPRVPNVKNYRQRHWDHESQIIPAKYISWSYFPWNVQSKLLFHFFLELFVLRNILAGLDRYRYLDGADTQATARLAFQFYPSGAGYMHEHQDPYSEHQFALPTLLLSNYGKDYKKGGFFAVNRNNEKVVFDENLEFGDLTLFHPSIPHGVEAIDPEADVGTCKSITNGRLMMIAGVNGYSGQGAQYDATVSKNAQV